MSVGVPSRSQRDLPSNADAPRVARRFVRDALVRLRAPEELTRDFELAVSELIANLVEYGDGDDITVCIDADERQWTMEVRGGRVIPPALRDPTAWHVSDVDQDRGRGLGIVRAVIDAIRVERQDGVVVVHCQVPREAALRQ